MMLAILLLGLSPPPPLPECDQAAADRGIQLEMNMCAFREFALADRALNEQWAITSARMKQRDADRKAYDQPDDNRPGYFESLLEAQRAWLTYRDAHCRLDGYYARGGSLEPLLVSTCKTALTKARTQELKELAQSPD